MHLLDCLRKSEKSVSTIVFRLLLTRPSRADRLSVLPFATAADRVASCVTLLLGGDGVLDELQVRWQVPVPEKESHHMPVICNLHLLAPKI